MLLIKSSKLSIPDSFSMSIIWKILTGLLLSLSSTFTGLFQNQVEWIFPAFLSWPHLLAKWWISWHMLSDMKNLPENFSWHRSSDLFWTFFQLTSTFHLLLTHLWNHNKISWFLPNLHDKSSRVLIPVYWYKYPSSHAQKKQIYHFLHWYFFNNHHRIHPPEWVKQW